MQVVALLLLVRSMGVLRKSATAILSESVSEIVVEGSALRLILVIGISALTMSATATKKKRLRRSER